MYRGIVRRILTLTKEYSGKTDHTQSVEFFFYANTEDKACNLAIELRRLDYEVYCIDKSTDKWSVIGCTPPISLNETRLTEWGESMYELANEHGIEFDGWGKLI